MSETLLKICAECYLFQSHSNEICQDCQSDYLMDDTLDECECENLGNQCDTCDTCDGDNDE